MSGMKRPICPFLCMKIASPSCTSLYLLPPLLLFARARPTTPATKLSCCDEVAPNPLSIFPALLSLCHSHTQPHPHPNVAGAARPARRLLQQTASPTPSEVKRPPDFLELHLLGKRCTPQLDFVHIMDQQPKDDIDFLEPSILLDETHYQGGFKNGYQDGLVSGKEEGRQVGLKMGFQVGEELGFYQGCLDVWMSVIRLDQDAFSARVRKNIEQLAAFVSNYPLSDPENEQVQDMMEKIRLKFRIITASLGAKLEYEGRPTSAKQDVEDL